MNLNICFSITWPSEKSAIVLSGKKYNYANNNTVDSYGNSFNHTHVMAAIGDNIHYRLFSQLIGSCTKCQTAVKNVYYNFPQLNMMSSIVLFFSTVHNSKIGSSLSCVIKKSFMLHLKTGKSNFSLILLVKDLALLSIINIVADWLSVNWKLTVKTNQWINELFLP